MTAILISATVIIGLIGLSTVMWSFMNTREKFYKEYKSRKRSK